MCQRLTIMSYGYSIIWLIIRKTHALLLIKQWHIAYVYSSESCKFPCRIALTEKVVFSICIFHMKFGQDYGHYCHLALNTQTLTSILGYKGLEAQIKQNILT